MQERLKNKMPIDKGKILVSIILYYQQNVQDYCAKIISLDVLKLMYPKYGATIVGIPFRKIIKSKHLKDIWLEKTAEVIMKKEANCSETGSLRKRDYLDLDSRPTAKINFHCHNS